ncbi:hypothetical protein GCM10023084_70560 [Streptomyces lacrimifluminis]|uniref:Uncharacterized protein n=1 Tax=Streptomyces lacrimifluminis TaxID=1500077 RepID=A0A917L3V7_9ACTN|nr:hypothetical protein GCM10012282_45560 [Streptomyces lacrimifluminis]
MAGHWHGARSDDKTRDSSEIRQTLSPDPEDPEARVVGRRFRERQFGGPSGGQAVSRFGLPPPVGTISAPQNAASGPRSGAAGPLPHPGSAAEIRVAAARTRRSTALGTSPKRTWPGAHHAAAAEGLSPTKVR